MKTITKFVATGVHDYLKMDVDFDPNLTFLHGLNGSGKTTALKLIMALIEPSIEDLIQIPFSTLKLMGITRAGKECTIEANKKKGKDLKISCSLVPGEHYHHNLSEISPWEQVELFSYSGNNNGVISAIRELVAPIFLGIDRRFRAPSMPSRRERSSSTRQMAFEFERNKHSDDPTYDAGLAEIVVIIEDYTSRLRRSLSKIDDSFRKQILLDSLAYFTPSEHFFTPPNEKMFTDFANKKVAIMKTLNSLELGSPDIEKRSEEFFSTIEKAMISIRDLMRRRSKDEELSADLANAMTEWFVNQSQVDRIDRLFELANRYQSQQEHTLKPLNDFISLTNRFLKQTGKEISIDRAGDVKINVKSKTLTLRALSSGERQMFIMLAHLSLNQNLPRDGVFIVDEPELSLHMAWQDMFVDAVEAANPKLQIILATHSPSIIGGRNSFCRPVSNFDSGEDE